MIRADPDGERPRGDRRRRQPEGRCGRRRRRLRRQHRQRLGQRARRRAGAGASTPSTSAACRARSTCSAITSGCRTATSRPTRAVRRRTAGSPPSTPATADVADKKIEVGGSPEGLGVSDDRVWVATGPTEARPRDPALERDRRADAEVDGDRDEVLDDGRERAGAEGRVGAGRPQRERAAPSRSPSPSSSRIASERPTAKATSTSPQPISANGTKTAPISAPIARPLISSAVIAVRQWAPVAMPADHERLGLRADRVRHVDDGRHEEGEQDLLVELLLEAGDERDRGHRADQPDQQPRQPVPDPQHAPAPRRQSGPPACRAGSRPSAPCPRCAPRPSRRASARTGSARRSAPPRRRRRSSSTPCSTIRWAASSRSTLRAEGRRDGRPSPRRSACPPRPRAGARAGRRRRAARR